MLFRRCLQNITKTRKLTEHKGMKKCSGLKMHFFLKVKGLFLTSRRLKTQHLWEVLKKKTIQQDVTESKTNLKKLTSWERFFCASCQHAKKLVASGH